MKKIIINLLMLFVISIALVACTSGDPSYTVECAGGMHDLINYEKKETSCIETGYDAYDKCSRCDYTTYEEIEDLGHDMSDWNVVNEATTDTDGIKNKKCLICNKIFEEITIPCTEPSDLTYTVNDDGVTCTVTGLVNSSDTKVVISSSIDGYIVTTIGSNAFYNKKTITNVVM